ncbi:MAG: glycerol-3-phosphate 1-O-acyltransferase PlsY [Eubacteriales bacterium]|nr:glycerol-3-phosphate 1-O-acyltransferase PlsY [Eubacteriales bacterium]
MGDILVRIACLAIGYLFGLFQTAYIYGRCKGIDIRKYGSGNAGTTNTMRVLGTKAGLIVFAGDVLKCIAAVLLVTALFSGSHPEMIYLLKMYTTAGCVLGHDYPFYMNFKGGKGIAVTAGFILSYQWTFIPVGVLMFFVPFLTTHYVSLGSLLVYVGFMIQLVIEGQLGMLGAPQPVLIEMYVIGAALAAMAFYQHRANIGRLLKGTERKTYLRHNKALLDPDKK